MPKNAQEALAELIESLKKMNANELAEEIQVVIARGRTIEIEPKGRAKELTPSPLEADEAYRTAVEMLIASMEPLLIRKNLQHELSSNENMSIEFDWRSDFVDKSPIATEELKTEPFPKIDPHELNNFERDLKKLLFLLQEE